MHRRAAQTAGMAARPTTPGAARRTAPAGMDAREAEGRFAERTTSPGAKALRLPSRRDGWTRIRDAWASSQVAGPSSAETARPGTGSVRPAQRVRFAAHAADSQSRVAADDSSESLRATRAIRSIAMDRLQSIALMRISKDTPRRPGGIIFAAPTGPSLPSGE